METTQASFDHLIPPIYGNRSVQNSDWFAVLEEIDIY